jgi:hypothetical protein
MEGDGQERETQSASPRKERAFKDVGNARDSSPLKPAESPGETIEGRADSSPDIEDW